MVERKYNPRTWRLIMKQLKKEVKKYTTIRVLVSDLQTLERVINKDVDRSERAGNTKDIITLLKYNMTNSTRFGILIHYFKKMRGVK